ncbi:MAG: DUF1549 domain-containing protein, partial [Armatimonadetes bacterium]|nr:DUF1549 domain-containing protein [Armatimonadota bacterium]
MRASPETGLLALTVKLLDRSCFYRKGKWHRPRWGTSLPGLSRTMHRSFRPLLLLSVLAAALELPAAAAPVSFLREVHPILSKAGCNQGICHGNANGKGGLKLSLRGQDPEMDHRALTRDAGARRWNRADPGRSLLLLKPTGALPHLGGIRFASHSAFSRTLAAWIAAGAPEDLHTAPALTELVVAPREQVVYALGPGKQEVRPLRQQIRVTARYGDGSTRDVTALACYESSDDKVSAAPDGQVVAPEGGDAGILVRFGGRMQTIRLTFVPRRPTVPFRAFPVRNYVDRLALEKLQALRLPPSELCDDSTFLRRLYLDTLGFPPSPAEVREFLAECGTERAGGKPRPGSGPAAAFATRERWVDRVLARPEYADFWVVKWADLLRAEERTLDPLGMQAFYGWLRKGFLENRPLDQFARDLLTATGSTYDQPAAAYYRRSRTPDLLAENTAQLFMGVRLNCAKCHN